jgi:hypothetical protein
MDNFFMPPTRAFVWDGLALEVRGREKGEKKN